jgi:DNA-binding transcriptional MerR regulator
MNPENTLPDKRYYTISEVAAYFNLNASTLRHWETEFKHLRPQTNVKGDRRYTRQNITDIEQVYVLVKQNGYTLQGARDFLSKNKNLQNEQIVERLQNIRAFLLDLKSTLRSEEK